MDSGKKYNVFVVGYDDFNMDILKDAPISREVNYLPALTYHDLKASEDVPALELLNRAMDIITGSGVEPDAVITFWDFPGTIITAILAGRLGLISPSARSVFKCEHKVWSRAEQRKVIINSIPFFSGFDPHDESAYEKINLLPPFWIKPVKSFKSYLAFRVNSRVDFERYRQELMSSIDGIYLPFQSLMRKAHMPVRISSATESCIAESVLSGHMCTVEGYVFDDEIVSYGVVDSICEDDSNSFNRYQYPSLRPMDIQYRMMDLTRRVVEKIGLKDCCFNVEYFYNQTEESIHLLEINPRTSQSHSDLFAKVHGCTQYQLLLEIVLGQKPRSLRRDGKFRMAAKYMHRSFKQGVVKRLPGQRELDAVLRKFPSTKIKFHVREGDDLGNLPFQDAYSYEIADIYVGADNEVELGEKYDRILEMLDIEIE